jgi:Tol biopolymer transport system component
MSPDGKHIRYFKGSSLWETSSSGKDLHQLFPGWKTSNGKCCGAWSPDGSIFAFLVGPGAQLWAIDERSGFFPRPHSQPVQLTSSPINWSTPAFSKDGKQIYCMGSTSRGELIRFDPKSDQFRPFLGGISANLLSFSKDGQTVAYSTFPDGVLWKSNVDGTGRVQLTDPPLFPEWVGMSPDGGQVVFMAPASEGFNRAYLVSSQGGGSRLLRPAAPDRSRIQVGRRTGGR